MASYGAQKRLHIRNEDGQTQETIDKADVTVADIVRGVKSPGVARMEAIYANLSMVDRVIIFVGTFLIAYAYGLDGGLRGNYQIYATSSFNHHSLLSTINVVRAVIAAAAQPTAGKIADIFGRVELLCISVVLYTVGTIVEASANNVATFAGGSILYQIGYTMVILLVEVIIADITTTRARLFFSYIPALPFIINAWITGDIQASAEEHISWQWGIGMWAIIYPICALPLIFSLTWVGIRDRVRQHGFMGFIKQTLRKSNPVAQTEGGSAGARGWKFLVELFWAIDVIGVLLMIIVFGLILAPLTIAGGFASQWKQAKIIAPIVIGVVCIPVFIIWELRAPIPLIPFRLMGDRAVWPAIGVALFLNFSWSMQADFLYTVLQVSFNFTVKETARITLLYSFVSVIIGTILGAIVYKIRRLKPFIIVGTCLFLVAFGLLIHFRGATDANNGVRAGVIGAQVVLGIAGGLFPYCTQALLQVQIRHENMAVLTGIFLATYNIGSALGYSVAGALWTQLLPKELEKQLAPVNGTLAVETFAKPLDVITLYPIGTPERTAIIVAYQHIQKLLTITGICLCVPLIAFSLATRNVELNDKQSLAKDTDSSDEETGTDAISGFEKK